MGVSWSSVKKCCHARSRAWTHHSHCPLCGANCHFRGCWKFKHQSTLNLGYRISENYFPAGMLDSFLHFFSKNILSTYFVALERVGSPTFCWRFQRSSQVKLGLGIAGHDQPSSIGPAESGAEAFLTWTPVPTLLNPSDENDLFGIIFLFIRFFSPDNF